MSPVRQLGFAWNGISAKGKVRSPVPTRGKPGSTHYDWIGRLTKAEASHGVAAAAVVTGGGVGTAVAGAVIAAVARIARVPETGPADVEAAGVVPWRVVARIRGVRVPEAGAADVEAAG